MIEIDPRGKLVYIGPESKIKAKDFVIKNVTPSVPTFVKDNSSLPYFLSHNQDF